ncbi:MAG: DUF3574 domain-containing protein [Alphaproteobacteria bacterium]|nr:DUF3574 domain-containing protein [Alphaproteobacteria bacterium]
MRLIAPLAAAAAILAGCASPEPPSAVCRDPLKPALAVELFFGRALPGGGEVSDADWNAFLASEVSPRFPDGLSVLDVAGQYRGRDGKIVRERSKQVVVVVFDAPAHAPRVDAIAAAYRSRFRQESVFRVERPVCAGL